MENGYINELSKLAANLRNGIKLFFFRKTRLEDFHPGSSQAILLVTFFALVLFTNALSSSLPNPEFNASGFADIATQTGLILLAVHFMSRFYSIDSNKLLIVVLSLWPWFHLAWLMGSGNQVFQYWIFYGQQKYIYATYLLYFLAVMAVAITRMTDVSGATHLKSIPAFAVIVFVPLHFIYSGSFWYPNYDKETAKYNNVNQEDTYYRQFALMKELQKSLLPERKNHSDIYFVGFGSHAEQDVFMKEVKFARTLFDDRFDTRGRSIALINNRNSISDFPLATKSNLQLSLNFIGGTINPDEDIVFVYLTSHGSKKHNLSVDLFPLQLNTVGPTELKEALDKSGIKWRVLLVSACYSGGFVDPLKNDHTLILTASAKDKQSFGCSDTSDFTYFGKAVFKDQLANTYNFIEGFKQAIVSIAEREKQQKQTPSNPQLFVGKEIEAKLRRISVSLEKRNTHTAALQ